MIKVYPDGKFSSLLADGGLKEGDELEVTGPYGVFTLREKSERPLLFIGGGAGMAPILALLRSMAEQGSERQAVYYYGARGPQDLFHLEELAELERAAAELPVRAGAVGLRRGRGVGAASGADHRRGRRAAKRSWARWTPICAGRRRWSTPPSRCWTQSGVPESRVYYDKFTTTAP